MKYLMMIKHTEDYRSQAIPQGLMDAMGEFVAAGFKSGILKDPAGLTPPEEGFRLRSSRGKLQVTDGPFTETKEVVGGYWMIQVKSREEAIEWAKRCPGSENETIELRQVQEFAEFPADVQEAAAGFSEMQAQSGQRKGS